MATPVAIEELICLKLQRGYFLAEICSDLGISEEEGMKYIADASGLSFPKITSVLQMNERGVPLKKIKAKSKVRPAVLALLLPKITKDLKAQIESMVNEGRTPEELTELLDISQRMINLCISQLKLGTTQTTSKLQDSINEIVSQNQAEDPCLTSQPIDYGWVSAYIYNFSNNILCRTMIASGVSTSISFNQLYFQDLRWTQLPKDLIAFAGGLKRSSSTLAFLDPKRDFAFTHGPPMLFTRYSHGLVHYEGFIYATNGADTNSIDKCERYNLAENRWESLPPSPRATNNVVSCVAEVDKGLYVFGRHDCYRENVTLVQKLNLSNLIWDQKFYVLRSLPPATACFMLNKYARQIYLCHSSGLTTYKLYSHSFSYVKSGDFDFALGNAGNGLACYFKGILFCVSLHGEISQIRI